MTTDDGHTGDDSEAQGEPPGPHLADGGIDHVPERWPPQLFDALREHWHVFEDTIYEAIIIGGEADADLDLLLPRDPGGPISDLDSWPRLIGPLHDRPTLLNWKAELLGRTPPGRTPTTTGFDRPVDTGPAPEPPPPTEVDEDLALPRDPGGPLSDLAGWPAMPAPLDDLDTLREWKAKIHGPAPADIAADPSGLPDAQDAGVRPPPTRAIAGSPRPSLSEPSVFVPDPPPVTGHHREGDGDSDSDSDELTVEGDSPRRRSGLRTKAGIGVGVGVALAAGVWAILSLASPGPGPNTILSTETTDVASPDTTAPLEPSQTAPSVPTSIQGQQPGQGSSGPAPTVANRSSSSGDGPGQQASPGQHPSPQQAPGSAPQGPASPAPTTTTTVPATAPFDEAAARAHFGDRYLGYAHDKIFVTPGGTQGLTSWRGIPVEPVLWHPRELQAAADRIIAVTNHLADRGIIVGGPQIVLYPDNRVHVGLSSLDPATITQVENALGPPTLQLAIYRWTQL